MTAGAFGDSASETLICDRPAPGVARITLNRPQAMNAYSFAMTQELQTAIAAYRDDDGLRALILTGAGFVAPVSTSTTPDADLEAARSLNASLLERAEAGAGVDYLAAPKLGAAFAVSRIEQMFMLADRAGAWARPSAERRA